MILRWRPKLPFGAPLSIGPSGPHLLAAWVEGRLDIDAGRAPRPKNLDLEQARAFILGKGGRHIALRHRLLHVMRIAARRHPADHAPVAVDDAAHGGRAFRGLRATYF